MKAIPVRAVAALDEPPATNPLAARVIREQAALVAAGSSPEEAARRAGYRIFGSQPGAYGAGLQVLIDERIWRELELRLESRDGASADDADELRVSCA